MSRERTSGRPVAGRPDLSPPLSLLEEQTGADTLSLSCWGKPLLIIMTKLFAGGGGVGLSKAFTSMCGYACKRGANWYVLIAAAFLATSEAAYWPPRSAKTGEQRCERIQVEIKDGVCTGSIFPSFATCTWDTDGFNTTEQKGAFMSKNYSLSTDECLELTAGKGVAAGSLPGAKYLNAATVTSNATGWCVVGQAGAFCDYLQGAALTTECELYDWDEDGKMKSATYDVDAAWTTDCEKCEKCQRGTGSETPCQ